MAEDSPFVQDNKQTKQTKTKEEEKEEEEDRVGGGREQGSRYDIRAKGAVPPGLITVSAIEFANKI